MSMSPLKIEIKPIRQAELHTHPANNPFIPPQGDVCLINDRLPLELLVHIFELGSADHGIGDITVEADHKMTSENANEGEEETGAEKKSSAISLPFRFVASHVCRHWRNVAISTPALWTKINVTPAIRPPYEVVSMLLERSKNLPIDVRVYSASHKVKHGVEPLSDTDLESLFSLLIPHIHRWRAMEVSLRDCRFMYAFFRAVSDPSITTAPQLTSLELYDYEDTERFDGFPYPNISKHLFGGSAPSLTTLVLWGVHVDWSQPWIASASNLRKLELAFHSKQVRPLWTQFSTILRNASALKELVLRNSGPYGDPDEWFTDRSHSTSDALIQLPHVTDFGFMIQSQAYAIGVFRKLYMPALKSLVLWFYDGDCSDLLCELAGPAASLSPAQEPCSILGGLQNLRIAGLRCRTECIRIFYNELRNLTSLTVSLGFLDRFFLDILSMPCLLPGGGGIWLPRLTTLRVSGAFASSLRVLVSKRREFGAPLSSLYLEKGMHVCDDTMEWFKENLETFQFFEGSDDEAEDTDYDDLDEEYDEDDVDMDEEVDDDDTDDWLD